MVKVQGVPCAPNLFAVVPLLQLIGNKPNQNAQQAATGTPQGQTKINQGQTQAVRPTGQTITKPTQSPTGTAPPTASSQRIIASPPPPPFFVTLQGVTTYDAPMAVMPQTRGISYLGQPYKAIPASWVSSGKGTINLKVCKPRRFD